MTNKIYLNEYRSQLLKIKSTEDMIAVVTAQMERVGGAFERFGHGSGRADPLPALIDHKYKLQHTRDRLIVDNSLRYLAIIKAIEALPDYRERVILRLRYIDGLNWDDITAKMNYSKRHIFQLHGYALQNLCIESH